MRRFSQDDQPPRCFELAFDPIAKTLGITIPPWLRLRADEVIE